MNHINFKILMLICQKQPNKWPNSILIWTKCIRGNSKSLNHRFWNQGIKIWLKDTKEIPHLILNNLRNKTSKLISKMMVPNGSIKKAWPPWKIMTMSKHQKPSIQRPDNSQQWLLREIPKFRISSTVIYKVITLAKRCNLKIWLNRMIIKSVPARHFTKMFSLTYRSLN